MLILRAILQLVRLDSAILAFLAVFLPTSIRTKDLALSFGRAVPLLFIGMCTFIANDLDDLEKDQLNHPERPLPSGYLRAEVAAVLYFAFLGLALFLTRFYATQAVAFWYYGLFILSISYGYVVEFVPIFKAPYVALASSVPLLIVASSFSDRRLYFVAVALFLLIIGRELCLDIRDRRGDAPSAIHRLPPRSVAVVAFCIQAFGLVLLTTQSRKLGDVVNVFVMAFLLWLAAVYWFKRGRYKPATVLMKLQLFAGLYLIM